MSKWIRRDDQVVAIAGNEKGRVGKVVVRRGNRVVVEGFNVRTKTIKPSQMNPKGGMTKVEMPMDVSNLAFCNQDGKPVKTKVRFSKEGAKELYYRDGEKEVILRQIKGPKAKA